MSSSVLEVQDLEVKYQGTITAIRAATFGVPEKSIVAVLGPNGAGKTSLIRGIHGFLSTETGRVTAGRVVFAGQTLQGRGPATAVKHGVAIIPEREKIFGTLTVGENLRAIPRRSGASKGEVERYRELAYELFPVLKERERQSAGTLSGGERQMLAISRALLTVPRLILADELSLGIAPALVTMIMHALRTIRDETGATIVLVEQNAVAAFDIADSALLLANGELTQSGTPEELKRIGAAEKLYFGGGSDEPGEEESHG